MTTVKEIKDELLSAIKNGEELEDIKDNSGEWIDGWVPIYNNRVIEEWQAMPGEYDNQGYAELGADGEVDIIRLMMLDLYVYYSALFYEAISELEEELEGEKGNA